MYVCMYVCMFVCLYVHVCMYVRMYAHVAIFIALVVLTRQMQVKTCDPQATGRILGLSDTILGLTVLAFANSVGDLVANLAMARAGMPGMAAAACIGAPLLNLLLGLGSATFLGNILVSMHNLQPKPDRNYLGSCQSFPASKVFSVATTDKTVRPNLPEPFE
jgi:Ca2+/Na+ antiporter